MQISNLNPFSARPNKNLNCLKFFFSKMVDVYAYQNNNFGSNANQDKQKNDLFIKMNSDGMLDQVRAQLRAQVVKALEQQKK